MFKIEMGTLGFVYGYSSSAMCIQSTDEANAKTFKTEKAAQKYIDKNADCGYGLNSKTAKIVPSK